MNEPLALDPAGHVKLAVKDFKKSKEFYSLLFKQLEFQQVADHETSAAWVTREGFGVWISQAKRTQPAYVFSAPGLHHICFKAKSKEEVDAVYNNLKTKTHIFDAPAAYLEYSPIYYAVFFADPDGIKLEVAHY
jgi:catechol 2,3-dioxygenase-like lactoylglutathione lyase family enzyme